MDCETTIIFTKDPQYIVNAHSWPDEVKKKEAQNAKQEKPANSKETAPPKRGFMDNLGSGVTDIFSRKPAPNTRTLANDEKQPDEKGKLFVFFELSYLNSLY